MSSLINVEHFGFIQDVFNKWLNTANIDIDDYSIENILCFYLNSMNMDNEKIIEALHPEYQKKLENLILNDDLNIHGYGYYQLIEESIRGIITCSPYRPFETEADKWIEQKYSTYNGQSRLLNVLLLNNDAWDASKKKIVHLLCDEKKTNEYFIFYHGCRETAAHSICLNDVGLQWNNPRGTDFGPGFYVARNLLDALLIAQRQTFVLPSPKPGENPGRAACVIFHCPKEEFNRFSILKLEENSIDSTSDRSPIVTANIRDDEIFQWKNFLHLCHDQRYPHPLVKSYDAIEGEICNNIREVQTGTKAPRCKNNSWQLCIRSTALAEKFSSWIVGIIILETPISG